MQVAKVLVFFSRFAMTFPFLMFFTSVVYKLKLWWNCQVKQSKKSLKEHIFIQVADSSSKSLKGEGV